MCVLANLSLQLKRSLAWDEAKGRVISDEEANQLLARQYRPPWIRSRPRKGSNQPGSLRFVISNRNTRPFTSIGGRLRPRPEVHRG